MIQFAYPLLLWLLLLVPLLLLVMIVGQRRRRKQQLRFATPQMLRQIMPDRSAKRDWWRASLKLIAIAAMVFDHCMVVFIPHDLAIYEVLRMPGTPGRWCRASAAGTYSTSSTPARAA